MQGTKIQVAFHIPGTLAANIAIAYKTPFPMTLEHVSAVSSNDSDATLAIGNTTTAGAYLVACVIGDTLVPVESGKAAFVGTEYPHIPKGTVMKLDLDFDGAAGTAAANVTIILTFSEG